MPSCFSRLAITALFGAAALVGCTADIPSESSGSASEALVPQPDPPDAFPTPIGCAAGTTCTFRETAMPVYLPLPCTEALWFSETGATNAAYRVAYCTKGATAIWAKQIPSWIAQHPSWNASASETQDGLPPAESGDVYLRFLPPTPPELLDYKSYPDGAYVEAGPLSAPLPCSPYYVIAHTHTGVAYCVDTPEVEAWAASVVGTCRYPHPVPDCTTAYAWLSNGKDQGLVAPEPGYIYMEAYSAGGPIGGGCPGGCGVLVLPEPTPPPVPMPITEPTPIPNPGPIPPSHI
jgi:hypothetical protein